MTLVGVNTLNGRKVGVTIRGTALGATPASFNLLPDMSIFLGEKMTARKDTTTDPQTISADRASEDLSTSQLTRLPENSAGGAHEGPTRSDKATLLTADMRRLTEIDERCFVRDAHRTIVRSLPDTLSDDDLRFIYEIDRRISKPGFYSDPRIPEIIQPRDKRSDFARMFNVDPSVIAISPKELTPHTRFLLSGIRRESYHLLENHPGDLFIREKAELVLSPIVSLPPNVTFHGPADFLGCISFASIPEGTVFNDDCLLDGCFALESIHESVTFRGDVLMTFCRDDLRKQYERKTPL